MNKLREELGISTGHGPSKKTPVAKRVENTLQGASKALVATGKGAMRPAQREKAIPAIASAVANATPAEALVEAIILSLNRLAGLDTVTPAQVRQLADVTSKVVGVLTAKAKLPKAKIAEAKAKGEKAAAKVVAAAKAKGNGKPAQVTAH